MTRFLATWELGLGYGHVASLIPVAIALGSQGHEVALAAPDARIDRRHASGIFGTIVQSPVHRGPAASETLTYGQVIADGGYTDPETLDALIRSWLTLFETIAPAALLVEHAPVSLLAAHLAGLPALRLGPTFTAPHAHSSHATLQPWIGHGADAIAAAAGLADGLVQAMCRRFGAPVLDGLPELLASAPGYPLTWPEADHYGPQPGVRYYGPLGGLPATARPAWPTGPGRRVLVYLRFDRPAGAAVADALGRLGWPALWHAPTPPPRTLTANIAWSAAPLDLMEAARGADMFIGRGSHGASTAMLCAGLPQLLFPDTLESVLLTWRLRQAGIALSQSARDGIETIASKITLLAESSHIRETAFHLGEKYAAYDGETAANALTKDMLSRLSF